MTDQPPPVLDARNSDEIMASLAELSRESLPAWQPPPDGDAGTMLHRGFARLLELALLRLNQVPEKNFLAFLDTMGVSLLPPALAHVPLTFTLAPGSAPTEVPAPWRRRGRRPASWRSPSRPMRRSLWSRLS